MKKAAFIPCLALLSLGCSTQPAQKNATVPVKPLLAQVGTQQLDSTELLKWLKSVPTKQSKTWTQEQKSQFQKQQLLAWVDAQSHAKLNPLTPEASLEREQEHKEMYESELARRWYQTHFEERVGDSPKVLQEKLKLNSLAEPEQNLDSLLKQYWVTDSQFLAFFESNRLNWKKPFQYELALIVVNDPKNADSVRLGIQQKTDFGALATRFSLEKESAARNGVYGWFYPGIDVGPMRPHVKWLGDTLFRTEGKSVGKIYELKHPGTKNITFVKVLQYLPEEIPQLSDVQDFALEQYRAHLTRKAWLGQLDSIRKNRQIQETPLTDEELKALYPKFKDKMLSPRAWRVQQVVFKDSSSAEESLKRLIAGGDWKSETARSVKWNSKNHLDLGWIKEGYSLTYGYQVDGFGDSLLQVTQPKLVQRVFKGNAGWHVLRVDSVRAPSEKPWDRVQAQFKSQVQKSWGFLPENRVVYTDQGQAFLVEADLNRYFDKIPLRQRKQYSRESVIEQLVNRYLMVVQAKAFGFDQEPENQILKQMLSNHQGAQQFRGTFGNLDDYAKKKSLNADSLKRALVPNTLAEIFWRAQADTLAVSSAFNLKQGQLDSLKDGVLSKHSRFWQDRWLWVQREKAGVKLADEFSPASHLNAQALLKKCEGEKNPLLLKSCENVLTEALFVQPNRPKADTLWFTLGQTLNDQKKYQEAVAAFGAVDVIGSKGPSHSKALFMLGFIQMEYLKQDKAAQRNFEKMLALYPQSELADDADFLVRDLKSGRKLSEEMLKKLQSESP